MIPGTLRNIRNYTTDNQDLRKKFLNVVDSFEYASDPKDRRILTMVLNRMTVSPSLASSMCALCVGYEDIMENMSRRDKTNVDKLLRSVGRVSKRHPDTDMIRRYIDSEELSHNDDDELSYLENLVGLNEDDCKENGGKYRNNRCDIVKDDQDLRCGLSTRFNCQYGSTVGMRYCSENPQGTRCVLSEMGRKSRKRKDAKQRSRARR